MYISRETADRVPFIPKEEASKGRRGGRRHGRQSSFSFLSTDLSMLLLMAAWIIGMVLLFSVKLADNPYQKLWKEPLLFDKAVKGS